MALKALVRAWVTVCLVVVVREGVEGLPGTYGTFDPLRGKYIPENYAVNTTKATFENCTLACQQHVTCNAFAFSRLESKCFLYAKGRDQRPVKIEGFTLYVQLKDPNAGYYRYETRYLKIIYTRMTYYKAAEYCDMNFYGSLVYVTGEGMNNFLEMILRKIVLFAATIGITDEKEEGRWVYSNTDSEIGYSNWNWRGMWKLKDRNCAVMEIDGTWSMSQCWERNYFICQIPLY